MYESQDKYAQLYGNAASALCSWVQDGEESTSWNTGFDGNAASTAGYTWSAAGDILGAGDAD